MADKVYIEGFVAKNPETRQAGDHSVTTITVPVEQGRRKNGEWVPDLDKDGQKIVRWWEAEFWNEYGAQVAQEIQKGYLVKIEGEPRARAFVKTDGTAGLSLVVADAQVAIVVRRPVRGGGSGASSGAGMGAWSSPSENGAQGGFQDTGFSAGFDENQPF